MATRPAGAPVARPGRRRGAGPGGAGRPAAPPVKRVVRVSTGEGSASGARGLVFAAGRGGSGRAISTGQLRGLPRFHLRPIDVMVSHGSRRDLVLRGASRLDAFSGYPVRT